MINESLEHKQYLKELKRKNMKILITRLFILAAFFILWEVAGYYKWVDPFLTSTPTRMWKSLIKIYNEGSLFKHIIVTVYETILGFLLSTILGAIIAIMLWWSDFASKVLEPYIVVLNALPKVALAPIIIFWMGNGMKAIVLVAILISIIVTIINVLNGFNEVSQDKIKLLKTFGATKLQILTYLIIPASVPTLISTLKINVGLSWVGVIMGEFLVSKNGLGFLIVFGGQIAQLDTVMMSIVILCVLAYLMYTVVATIERKFIGKR